MACGKLRRPCANTAAMAMWQYLRKPTWTAVRPTFCSQLQKVAPLNCCGTTAGGRKAIGKRRPTDYGNVDWLHQGDSRLSLDATFAGTSSNGRTNSPSSPTGHLGMRRLMMPFECWVDWRFTSCRRGRSRFQIRWACLHLTQPDSPGVLRRAGRPPGMQNARPEDHPLPSRPTPSAVGGGGTSLSSKPKSPYSAHEERGITASLTRVISRSAYTESVRVFGTVVVL